MTTTDFVFKWIIFDEFTQEMHDDIDQLIQDEVERRMPSEDDIEDRLKQGLYSNTKGFPENIFRLGVNWLKSKLLKP